MKPAKRQKILDAAERLFERFGPGKTGVDEIAAAAGVAKGTLYNYFGSKEGIVRELVSSKIELFENTLRHTIEGMSDPLEKLKSAALERFRFLHRSPYIASLLLERSDANANDIALSFEEHQRGVISRILEEARRRGIIRRSDSASIADGVLYLLKGLELSLKNRLDTVHLEDLEAEISRIIPFFFSRSGRKPGRNRL